MRRAGWIAAFITAVAAAAAVGGYLALVTGKTPPQATPMVAATTAAPLTAAQHAAEQAAVPTPSPTQSGVAYPGTLTCLLSTRDGDYTVFVVIHGTASCAEWSQSLAGDGQYWLIDGNGGPVNGNQTVCELAAGDGMTMAVFEWTDVQEPIGGSVAQGVCVSMEQDGWTPQEG